MDDVLREVLQVQQFFSFLLKFTSLALEQMGQEARQIRYRQESQTVADTPNDNRSFRGKGAGETRDGSAVSQNLQRPEQGEADGGNNKSSLPGKQDTGDDDGQQIQRNEIAVLQPSDIHRGSDQQQVAPDLQTAVPRCVRYPADQNQLQKAERQPEHD